eukprot:scaffold6879_cov150-Skeletonema_menzelii.AAC.7
MFKKRTKKQGSSSKETKLRDGSSKIQFRLVSSRRSPTTEMKQKHKKKHQSKSLRKRPASRASSTASRMSSSTASTAASTVASSHVSRKSIHAAEIPPLSNSGSDVTTGPVDDLIFALGEAITKGANEVEDFVEIKIADGFESLKNTWDRFTVGLTLMYGDNSTIGTNFSEDRAVELVKDKRVGGSLGIHEDDSQASAKASAVTGEIKDQVQGLIDSFFLVEV